MVDKLLPSLELRMPPVRKKSQIIELPAPPDFRKIAEVAESPTTAQPLHFLRQAYPLFLLSTLLLGSYAIGYLCGSVSKMTSELQLVLRNFNSNYTMSNAVLPPTTASADFISDDIERTRLLIEQAEETIRKISSQPQSAKSTD